MLLFKPIVITTLFLGSGNFSNHTGHKKKVVHSRQVEGHFATTGRKESISLTKPKLNADGTECDGKCVLVLLFSGEDTRSGMLSYRNG